MAWLRKTHSTPGAAQGGLAWTTPDDVVEVDDDLAAALLAIPGAGFLSVPAPTAATDPDPAAQAPAAAAKKTAPAKAAPAKTPVQE